MTGTAHCITAQPHGDHMNIAQHLWRSTGHRSTGHSHEHSLIAHRYCIISAHSAPASSLLTQHSHHHDYSHFCSVSYTPPGFISISHPHAMHMTPRSLSSIVFVQLCSCNLSSFDTGMTESIVLPYKPFLHDLWPLTHLFSLFYLYKPLVQYCIIINRSPGSHPSALIKKITSFPASFPAVSQQFPSSSVV